MFHADWPSHYAIDFDPDLPTGAVTHFSVSDKARRPIGLLIRITPGNARPWYATFEQGYDSRNAVTGVWAHPHPERLCVICKGAGWIIDSTHPELWECIGAFPITFVVPVPRPGLIVFADFTRLIAYDRNGKVWRTEELSWDGIKVSGIAEEWLYGYGFDAPTEGEVPFAVNLRSGRHTGGSAPPSR